MVLRSSRALFGELSGIMQEIPKTPLRQLLPSAIYSRAITSSQARTSLPKRSFTYASCLGKQCGGIFSSAIYGPQRRLLSTRAPRPVSLLNPKMDSLFKDLFGDMKSKGILEGFINLFLGLEGEEQIEIEEFLKPRKISDGPSKPTTFISLAVRSKGGERYLIELQTYHDGALDQRLLYYLGKDYIDQIADVGSNPMRGKESSTGVPWNQAPRVHVIAITSSEILRSHDVVESFEFRSHLLENQDLFNQWSITLIDLSKFVARSFDKLESEKDAWLYLMKSADRLTPEQVKVWKRRKGPFKQAVERLERISADPNKRREYEQSYRDAMDQASILEYREEKGRAAGRIEGREEGRLEERLSLVKNLINQGHSADQITEMLGLTKEEISSLISIAKA